MQGAQVDHIEVDGKSFKRFSRVLAGLLPVSASNIGLA
jgi:hypothetical protein